MDDEWGQIWKEEIDSKRDNETVSQADRLVYLCASIGGPLRENKWYVLAFRKVLAAIHEVAEPLREQLEQWTQWGIVEVSIRNPQVAEYVKHWEGRTEKSEAENVELRERVKELERERFNPLGDNHHNAAKCPYCRPHIESEYRTVQAQALREAADQCGAEAALAWETKSSVTWAIWSEREHWLRSRADALDAG